MDPTRNISEIDISTEDMNGEIEAVEEESQEFLQNESVDEYCKKVMGTIRLCQKYSNDLQGWHHYSDFSGVQFTMTRINNLLHSLIGKVFSHQDIKLDVKGYSLVDQFDIIREGNDALLERINMDVDEASGIRRNIDIEMVDSTVRTIRGPVNESTGTEMVLMAPRNVQKPQMFFSPKIDNSEKTPFIPTIKEKPNSLKPLSVMICLLPDGREYYSHPYEYELFHWTPPEECLSRRDPVSPPPMAETPFVFVDDEAALEAMMEDLKKAPEIAVDLEHHGFRSYQGLTCLIQISTRDTDYVVDPFPLRNQLFVLNEVFTHPKVTKVLHGSDQDVMWLQRDFGVYLVNVFDTHQAAIVLQYPHRSLANLLHSLCAVAANKTYQRADWRIRPLPEDFLLYARQDTHFLLYIHDLLRNELIDKGNEMNNLLQATFSRSTEICLRRYEKPTVGPDSHLDVYRRSKKHFNSRQLFALQQIYLWRDKVARQQDESVDYVLPKHMMMQMCEILPKEIQGILACCNPIPTLIKTEQLTLHQILRTAREMPLQEIPLEVSAPQSDLTAELSLDPESSASLTRKHDLTFVEDDPPGLSTIMNPQETLLGDLFDSNAVRTSLKQGSDLFGVSKESLTLVKTALNKLTRQFMSPFERYKLFVKFDAEEKSERQTMKAPPTDQDRIQKLKLHFLSLCSQSSASEVERKTESESESESEAENIQLQRLQDHIASLSSSKPSEDAKDKKTRKRIKGSINEKLHKKKRASSKKRKSSEGLDDVIVKKSKAEQNDDVIGKRVSECDVTPFDYSQQDLKVFEAKGASRNKRQIKERFKGKGSNRSSGAKKSGMKSISWGNQKRPN